MAPQCHSSRRRGPPRRNGADRSIAGSHVWNSYIHNEHKNAYTQPYIYIYVYICIFIYILTYTCIHTFFHPHVPSARRRSSQGRHVRVQKLGRSLSGIHWLSPSQIRASSDENALVSSFLFFSFFLNSFTFKLTLP